jgi:sulfide:quinone oxidoreductase
MSARIVVLGGGVGGTLTANLLAKHLSPSAAQITVADLTGKHIYQPGWLYVPFGRETPRNLVRSERGLLDKRVNLIVDDFTRIDTERRLVVADGGTTLPYDYLVIATGSRNFEEEVPGLAEGGHHFYSADAAVKLGRELERFDGGRVVVGVGGIPHRCPPAPLEFLLLLESELRRQGKRERTELFYTYPIGRVFTIETVAEFVAPILDDRGVAYETFFNLETVDPAARRITSMEGSEQEYDLLVMIPPHRGAQIIEASGIGDEQGWVPTDRNTLALKGQSDDERIYTVGDASDLPVSKSGSAAHFQAKVAAERISTAITGKPSANGHDLYDGHVMCFLELGDDQATTLSFDYEHPPQPPRPSRVYHWEKMIFNKAYWHVVPRGLV